MEGSTRGQVRHGIAECGVAVREGRTGPELGDLAVEVLRHEAPIQQFLCTVLRVIQCIFVLTLLWQ